MYSLNPAQKKAVEHKSGPLLIIAGAGTGKTRVITQRILWLIKKKKAKSDEILALTFTQKAAKEMEERVDETMPYGYEAMWISTFHSFADSILKQEAIYLGIDPAYILMSQAQEYVFFRSHLFEFSLDRFRPHGNPTKFIREILGHFSRLSDEDVRPEDYVSYVKKAKRMGKEERSDLVELSTVYHEYAGFKERESRLGFSDLVPCVLRLFRARPRVLKRYQKKFKYILVDEFQDTNYSQNELVSLLAGKKANTTVVGDDDQSIYKFRGAAISNILDFKKRYPSCARVVLAKNYRSSQTILNTAYALIRHNDPDRLEVTENIDKKLVSMRDVRLPRTEKRTSCQMTLVGKEAATGIIPEPRWLGESVRRIHEHSEIDEAEKIALEVEHLVSKEKKYQFSDIAILVRANDHATEIAKSLRYHKIPFRFLGSKGLYSRPEVKDLIAMLTVLADFYNDASLYRLLMLEPGAIAPREYVDLQRLARRKHLSLFELLEELINKKIGKTKKTDGLAGASVPEFLTKGENEQETITLDTDILTEEAPRQNLSVLCNRLISKRGQTWIEKLFSGLDKAVLSVSQDLPVGRILYDMAEGFGFLKRFAESQSAEDEWKAQNIGSYFKSIQRFEREHDHPGVREYLDYLEYSVEIGEDPQVEEDQTLEYDGVNISTIHGAKGLEFPIVFMVNLVNERFPTRRRTEVLPIPNALVKERLPEGDAHIQEERRLCYVGMTRAMDFLYLTSADYYAQGIRKKKQSIFLSDVGLIMASPDVLGDRGDSRKKQDLRRIVEEENTSDVEIPEDMRQAFLARIEKNLSYSHLSSYENCPYQFYLKYFIEIPGKVSAARSFGLSIHNTLREFYDRIIRSKSGFEGFEKMPNLDDLRDIYRQKWQSDGYEQRSQENHRYRAGKQALLNFYTALFSESDIPFQLEYHFRANIGNVRLKGVVDRIDQIEGGVRIIDYKTGALPRDEGEVKRDLQVPVYVMGIEQAMGVKVLAAEYIYVEGAKRIEIEISPEMREKAVAKIVENVELLRKMNFNAKPGALCRFCDYRTICDYAMME